MTNRELLEAAAKAAGIGAEWYAGLGMGVDTGHATPQLWNPLTDDGDALRLAVDLRLEIDIHHTGIAVRTPDGVKILVSADDESEARAATRRAIVRAAAAMSK